MRVLADSQALVWYLADPIRLTEAAIAALDEAESSDGIAVSAVTLPELWVATHKRSVSRRLESGVFELVKASVEDPALNFGIVPVTAATAAVFRGRGLARAPRSRRPLHRGDVARARAGARKRWSRDPGIWRSRCRVVRRSPLDS